MNALGFTTEQKTRGKSGLYWATRSPGHRAIAGRGPWAEDGKKTLVTSIFVFSTSNYFRKILLPAFTKKCLITFKFCESRPVYNEPINNPG